MSLPDNFNPEIYKLINNDLKQLSLEQLISHYINIGINQQRKYNIEVFVICGGKCGSTTLETTFKKNGYATIRSHGIEEFGSRNLTSLTLHQLVEHNIKYNLPTLIIDSYREPISRKISSFFHNLKKHNYNILDNNNLTNNNLTNNNLTNNNLTNNNLTIDNLTNNNLTNNNSDNVDNLIKIFNERIVMNLEDYHPINRIFDHLKIKHFETFDLDNKYNILKTFNITFVKIRFCDIENWGNILSNIMDKTITIHNDNLTKNYSYYPIYKAFKEKYVAPDWLIEKVKNDTEYNIYASF